MFKLTELCYRFGPMLFQLGSACHVIRVLSVTIKSSFG